MKAMATALAFLAVTAPGTTLFVAPDGNDAWSGTQDRPDAARTDGPLRSLTAARDRARLLRRGSPGQGVEIVLRGGLHCLDEPLVLGPEDSGSPAAPTVWRAYPGETATISGGRRIADWRRTTVAGRTAWQTQLPEVVDGAWNFRQLFVRRQDETCFGRRYRPHRGMLVVAGLTYSPPRKAMAHRAAQRDFVFFPGDLRPWENLADVELVALHSWSASRLRIRELDLEKNVVTLGALPTFRIGHWYKDERNPYFVENLKEELKDPGQWYLDRPTGVLTYLPLPGETPENTAAVAPVLEQLLVLKGADPEKGPFVENVRFAGLRFAHSAWAVPADGYDTSQGQPLLPAAIELSGARDCGLERCVVAHTGAYGAALGLGTTTCYVRGCFLHDLGGGGVKVGDSRMKQNAPPPLLPVGNMVENNTITNFGVAHFSANGIWAGIVRDTRIRHNTVSHGPYTGIAVGWNWSPTPTSAGGNIIENNHIHHVMERVQDGGGIYTLGRQPGNVIRGNVIHDNHCGRFACHAGQIGLYFDEGSSGFLVENNVVYDVAWRNGQIAQNRNKPSDHDIRTNYLNVRPGTPGFPQEIANRAGVEPDWRQTAFPTVPTPNPVDTMQWPELPEVPVGFSLDFEDVPLGRMPRRWNAAGFGEHSWFGASEEQAASGRRSLKAQDGGGQTKSFYPYIHYRAEVDSGRVELEFDFLQGTPSGDAAIEFRSYPGPNGAEYAAGPSLRIAPDGKLHAGGREPVQLPLDRWIRLRATFALGPEAVPGYTLSVAWEGRDPTTFALPFANPGFNRMTHLYIIAGSAEASSFYLDNLKLTVGK